MSRKQILTTLFMTIGAIFLISCGPTDPGDPCGQGLGTQDSCSSVVIEVQTEQGFDKCDAPTVAQMQTWWNDSPYYAIGIYVGGIHRACNQNNLDSDWIADVGAQGWNFIPTWVGPQAPCSNYTHRISSNAATAAQQGRDEAQDAISAMEDLGMDGDYIIYYDMEGFGPASNSCLNAVESFLEAWTDELQDEGHKSGVYGSACNSYASEWNSFSPRPDDAWYAHWTVVPGAYDANADVWNVTCVPDTHFNNSERIRQYAGDFNATYGGVQFFIDANALDGEVQSLANVEDGSLYADPRVDKVEMVTDEFGWIKAEGKLAYTHNGGRAWSFFNIPELEGRSVADAAFYSAENGHIVTNPTYLSNTEAEVTLLTTEDGGKRWAAQTVAIPIEYGTPTSHITVDFANAQVGWIGVKYATNSNFSRGVLLSTVDGGRTWDTFSVPMGEPVVVVDENTLWMAGGVDGRALFRSVDGGASWVSMSDTIAEMMGDATFYIGAPEFANADSGLLPVTTIDQGNASVLMLGTTDAGQSWDITKRVSLSDDASVAGSVAVEMVSAETIFVADDERARVTSLRGFSLGYNTATLNAPLQQLTFSSELSGMAVVNNGGCWGNKEAVKGFFCGAGSRLYFTEDGGRSWDLAAWDLTPEKLESYLEEIVDLREEILFGRTPADALIAIMKEIEPSIMEQTLADRELTLQLSNFLMTGETSAREIDKVVVDRGTYNAVTELFNDLLEAFPEYKESASASFEYYVNTYVTIGRK